MYIYIVEIAKEYLNHLEPFKKCHTVLTIKFYF